MEEHHRSSRADIEVVNFDAVVLHPVRREIILGKGGESRFGGPGGFPVHPESSSVSPVGSWRSGGRTSTGRPDSIMTLAETLSQAL